MRKLALFVWIVHAGFAQSTPEIRKTVERALPLLERSAATFVEQRACVSCHHNILPILMFHLARTRGVAVDAAVERAVEEKTFRSLRGPAALDDAVQAVTLNDPTPDDSFLLMAAHAAGRSPDLVTAVYARRLAAWQRAGHWVTSDFRPPHSSSIFTATASAVRAIAFYMPAELSAEKQACLERARQWLSAAAPASTEDAAFRLLGLVWADAPEGELAAARRDLLAMRKSGGWPELPDYPPDAYSTGESLFALRQSGVPVSDPAFRRGLRFLIGSQAADGSWRVRTRMISPADVSPPYFRSGFPYGKDEYLSYAGSCWAVMALLSALPESAPGAPAANPANAPQAPPWVRTALFGGSQELAALIDAGLDPNSKTAGGTTLLMLAAPDAGKVRLLLARGADPRGRATSGMDALTIAAAYRGTAAAIAALLDGGAELKPPPGVRLRGTPLLFASMTGDLANVRLLLARGADPAAGTRANTPLAAAVTFGYPDVVRTLIAAGAPATLTESSGINLLHWAVIADRPAVIPVLANAGVPINATDESGFTPLMYAATIDFGNTAALQVLLQAGADPGIRNGEGRTAPEQARYFRHARLAAALR